MSTDYNLRALFRQTPELMCILAGPEHRFEFVNEAHIRTLGFDATGKTLLEAQPESVEIHGIIGDVYRTGMTAELHEIPVTVGDRLRYFNLTYVARRDLEGTISGVMVLGTEISDQVEFRKAQQDQSRWLRMVLDHLPISVFLIDPTTNRITFSNQSAEKMLGLNYEGSLPDDRYGKTKLLAFKNGRQLNADEIPSARAARGEIFKDEEFIIRSHTGDHFVVATSEVLPASFGQNQTALLVLKDITELRKSEERLSMAVNVSKLGFYDWDVQQNKTVLSEQMKLDWGIDPASETETFESTINAIHPDDRFNTAEATRISLQTGEPFHVVHRVVHKDGKIVWLEIRGQVRYDNDGNPTRFIGTSVNITDQKLQSEELQLAKVAAEDANAAKSAFLANMSHEIRTPLGAIMGFVELMKNKNLKPADLETYISIINRNSGQLLRIIDDILDLSKVEAGRMSLESIDFNLSDLISDFASLMSFKANEKGILFEVWAETQLPEVLNTDPTRLRQILTNIVGNAIKFTDRGGVNLGVAYDDGVLEFTVADTGVGITPEQKEKLFQAFSQADVSTTRKFGGTGLGLVLTKKLCEILGGEFSLVASAPNQGSVFKASIQASAVHNTRLLDKSRFGFTSEPSVKPIEVLPLHGLRGLVADDSPDNRTLISITLNEMGVIVDLASDGREAVEKALKNHYDFILMDLQMPHMDGHEAIKTLHREGYNRPVIALTAHAMREERDRCMKNGFNGFLSKPLDRDKLQNEIAAQVAKNHSILIVEDDEDLRDLLLLFFRDQGQKVMWVRTGEEALEYFNAHAMPPLVLLDLTLPQMSGQELLEKISGREDRKQSRVIVASGWDDLEQRCKDLNADGFLKKPFNLTQLGQLLKSTK